MVLLLQHGHKDSFFGTAVKRKGDVEGDPSHEIEHPIVAPQPTCTTLARGATEAGTSKPVISSIYGWFTEGFGTLDDLKEAKLLLDALACMRTFMVARRG
jgi:hypothetical protein